MYWVWKDHFAEDDQAMIMDRPKVIDDNNLWFNQGRRVTENVPLIEIRITDESRGFLTDNLLNLAANGLLFSKKLRDVLQTVGVDNIDYYDCLLIDEEYDTCNDEYKMANIIGRVACLDDANSQLSMLSSNPSQILMIRRLAINEDAIEDLPIFRLHEYSRIVLVEDKVKVAIEEAGVTGVQFFTPADYRP